MRLLIILLLFPTLLFAEFTDETLDLSLTCKGKGEFYDIKNKTTATIVASDNLIITTNKQGIKNRLEFQESEFFCVTEKTKISCFNQNFSQPNYKSNLEQNLFLISSGKIVINRLTGEAFSNYSNQYGNYAISYMCQKGEVKF